MNGGGNGGPLLLLVESDPAERDRIANLLIRRFGADYEVATASGAAAAEALLASRTPERPPAVILAARVLDDASGIASLAGMRRFSADTMRVLLVGWPELWGDKDVRQELTRAAVLGAFDSIVARPAGHPENFYAALSELLATWTSRRTPSFEAVRVVGNRMSPETHSLRDVLQRASVPHTYLEAESPEGVATLERIGEAELPVAILHDGRVLVRPGVDDIADAIGVNSQRGGSPYDVVVVGAGPAGLAAAVYAASEGLRVLVVEAEAHGGQAATSSMIRNYLGFPFGISGAELAARAYEQALFFGAEFIFGRRAIALRRERDIRVVSLDDGTELRGQVVVLGMGVSYRRLGIGSVERLLGRGVYYGAALAEASAIRGEDVFVVGGANSAGQAAIYLGRFAHSVTLLLRGSALADGMSEYLVREIESLPNVHVRVNTEVVDADGEAALSAVVVRDRSTGSEERLPGAALFILIGAEPHTEWLPDEVVRDAAGYILTGEDAGPSESVPWASFETSLPGVFAVGDVRAHSTKRVAAAVGSGSAAIRQVHGYLEAILRAAR